MKLSRDTLQRLCLYKKAIETNEDFTKLLIHYNGNFKYIQAYLNVSDVELETYCRDK